MGGTPNRAPRSDMPARRSPGHVRRATAIGGGHGLSRTLAALTEIVDEVSAVVTVADDGGSSGRLRRDLAVLPPGDLRMALAALARDRELAELLQYRFDRGELAGHSLGNLVIVALQDLADGDPVAGLDRLARLLAVPGRVLPCSRVPVSLGGRTATGTVSGQASLATTSAIEEVWLEPSDPPVTPEAVAAIRDADLIVLGPGSLFTSLLPNLLVPGVAAALSVRRAPTVFVANLREQPGETQGLSLLDHLDVLERHVPGLTLDAIVLHEGARPSGGGQPLAADDDALAGRIARVVRRDLLDGRDGHDPASLAAALGELLED
jgi:uncharacterized cofD-like protein